MNSITLNHPLRRIASSTVAKTAAGLALALGGAAAMAQETDPFMVAVTTVTGKIETYGAALVGLAAVGVVFWLAIKYVKRIPSAG